MKIRKLTEGLGAEVEIIHSYEDIPRMFTHFRGGVVVGTSLYSKSQLRGSTVEDAIEDYFIFDIKTMSDFPFEEGSIYHYQMAISKDDMKNTF